jgi:hypothetical protein
MVERSPCSCTCVGNFGFMGGALVRPNRPNLFAFRSTIKRSKLYLREIAQVAELADAPDLGLTFSKHYRLVPNVAARAYSCWS